MQHSKIFKQLLKETLEIRDSLVGDAYKGFPSYENSISKSLNRTQENILRIDNVRKATKQEIDFKASVIINVQQLVNGFTIVWIKWLKELPKLLEQPPTIIEIEYSFF